MAKKTTEPTISQAIISKNENVRHDAPITFDGYRGKNGVPVKIKFDKDDKNYAVYGDLNFKVVVTDRVFLDLADPVDALKYKKVKEAVELDIYPFKSPERLLILEEPELEDREAVINFDRQMEALNILKNELSDPSARREFAYYFGLHHGTNDRVFLNLKEIAEETPEKFISSFNDELKGVYITVNKAIDAGIISMKGETGVYYYGDAVLGLNRDEIVNTLSKDAALMTMISKKANT